MVQLKKIFIVRSDGHRQRYNTTYRRLRSRGYVYSKQSRGWQYAREGTPSGRPVRQTLARPPPPRVDDEEFVEWTYHAKMDYNSPKKGHDIFEEGIFKETLRKGENPDPQGAIRVINDEARRKGFPLITDFEIVGIPKGVPVRQRNFPEVRVTATHK